jgi:hypothetical protein
MYTEIQEYLIVTNTNGTIIDIDGQQYQLDANKYLTLRDVNGTAMLTTNFPIQLVQMGQVMLHI